MNIKLKAFTLAEVLITLGIIGVVAALTIPTLVANYQKTQYATQLKKFYATFNQALKQYTADNSCPDDLLCTGLFENTADPDYQNTTGDALVKYFKVSKNGRAGGCYPAFEARTIHTKYDLSDAGSIGCPGGYQFITIDGIYVQFSSFSTCLDAGSARHITGQMNQRCGVVDIDLNGVKPPNAWGRDIFRFNITNGKGASLYPAGGIDDSHDTPWRTDAGTPQECYSGNTSGMNCAGRIMEDGWQMNY